jgi:hypothetical protein
MRHKNFIILLLLITCIYIYPSRASAQTVGKFLQIEGQVEIFKHGSLPSIRVKTQDGLDKNDIIQTRTNSKAQVQFIDDTLLTIAPETRLSVVEYLYEVPKSKRQATLMLIQGVIYTAVTRLLGMDKPEFVLITDTSVIGVRGTEWFTVADSRNRLTDVFNQSGSLTINSSSPGVSGAVNLTSMHATRILRNQPPGAPVPITANDLRLLRALLKTGLPAKFSPGSGPRDLLENIAISGKTLTPEPLKTPTPLPDRAGAGFSGKPTTPFQPPAPAPKSAPGSTPACSGAAPPSGPPSAPVAVSSPSPSRTKK